jgi:hypothetical protein
LVGDPNLYLVEAPALRPQEVIMDAEHIKQLEMDLNEAAMAPVGEEEDEEFK